MKRVMIFCAAVALLGGSYSLLVGAWSPHVESGTWAWIQPVSDQPPVSMVVERDGATAVLLPGGRILIAGGAYASGDPTNNVELFDQSGTFFAAMPMHVARAHHSATLLKSGLVLVAGGTTTGGEAIATAEIYDPAADSWTDAGSLPAPRSGHTATLLQDGQHLLITGGENSGAVLASMVLYTDGVGFSAAGSMSSPRKNHAAALLSDGRVLIAGGSDGTAALATSDLFDPADWTIGPGPAMSRARDGSTSTRLLDGQVVVIGGSDGSHDLATAESFDPATASFHPIGSSLASPRRGHLAFLLPNNNSVLVVGGTSSGSPVVTAELYRPWTTSFAATGLPREARVGATGSPLATDGLLLLAGGTGSKTAELYGFATVKTDKDDYAPGETVTITGSGWVPGETVRLSMVESPLLDTHPLLPVVADANGNIVSTEFAPDTHDIGVLFYLTGYGSASEAQTTFRDNKNVDVSFAGTGSGLVTSSPTGINCTDTAGTASGTCSASFGNNDNVTLTAAMTGGSSIGGWTVPSAYTVTSGCGATDLSCAFNLNNKNTSPVVVTINAGTTLTVTSVTGTYGGSTGAITATLTRTIGGSGVSGKTVTFTLNGGIVGTAGPTNASGVATLSSASLISPAKINVGTYTAGVGASFGGDSGFAASSATNSLTVNQKAITVTAAPNTKTYDGTTSAAAIPTVTSGGPLVSGDTANFTEVYDTKHAGLGKTLTPSGSVTDGNSGNNYTYTFTNDTTGVINALALTVKAATNTKTYDGTMSAAATPLITVGAIQTGDTANFTEVYDTKHAGSGKTLTPSGSVTDGNSGNNYTYTFTNDTTGVITALALTVKAATNTKTYDGTMSAAATPLITIGAIQTGDTANFTEVYDNKNVGTGKTLTPSGSVTDGNSGNNYTYTFTNDTTGVINGLALTVKAATNTKTYDGTMSAAATPLITVGAIQTGDTANFTEVYDNKNVGTGKTLTPSGSVTDGNSGNNYTYTFTNDTTGVINGLALTVKAATNTKTYDGTMSAAATPLITVGAIQTGDTANFTEVYDTKHAGSGKTLTPSGSVTDGNSGNNYTYTFTNDTTGVITALALTVKAATNTKTYDGTMSAAATPLITIGAIQTGDTANFTEVYDNKNVGTGKTLTPSGSVTDGNSGNNYTYTFTNDTTGVINPLSVAPHITAHNKIYDGTAAATLNTQTVLGVLPADEANVSLTVAEAHFSNANAGTGKTVTATGAALSGSESGNYTLSSTTATATADISPRPVSVKADHQTKMLNAPDPALTHQIVSGSLVLGDTFAGSLTRDPGEAIGTYPIRVGTLALNGNYALSFMGDSLDIVFLSTGLCQGQPGHQILQPVDANGTSVFKQKSTVPVKFRVCDANGNSVGTPGVVKSFNLVQTMSGTIVAAANEDVQSTTPDTTFRFDTTDRQWIFNINTKNLTANMTYVYRVTLADNSIIQFQFGLK